MLWLLRARLHRQRGRLGRRRLLRWRQFTQRIRQGRCRFCSCRRLFFRTSGADDAREVAFGCELKLRQRIFDKPLEYEASRVVGNERNPHLGFHAEAQIRVAVDRLEHVLAAQSLQRATGLAELDALVGDQRRPLNRTRGWLSRWLTIWNTFWMGERMMRCPSMRIMEPRVTIAGRGRWCHTGDARQGATR
ncbi:MAG: hypothetical protein AUH31_01990 [Armatimonadetes bacterium 13_1_40CM_64_14]|nr:MAG: hypothetical protein AUH31_01990 [Armatimonadetes bacterium 13_1_40CM_64_14]